MQNNLEKSPYYVAEDLTARWHISIETLTGWIRTKHLPAKKIGRRFLFAKDKVLAWERGHDFNP